MSSKSRVLLSKLALIVILPLSAQLSWAGNRDAVVGGALGGVIGGLVGSQIGGRDGAIVGAGIGAAAGVAISTNNDRRHDRYEPVHYDGGHHRDSYRGGYQAQAHYREHHHRRSYRNGGHRGDRGYYADRDGRGDYHSRYH